MAHGVVMYSQMRSTRTHHSSKIRPLHDLRHNHAEDKRCRAICTHLSPGSPMSPLPKHPLAQPFCLL